MKYPMTREGYRKLEKELKDLKFTQRPAVIEAIAVAREHGDLKENAEYHAARERQSIIEGRILEIENIMARANVIDSSLIKSNVVTFGATVKILNEETDEEHTYRIVGEFESDFSKGLISNTSPLGRALLGKEVNESIFFNAPGGVKYYEILDIKYD